MIELEGIINMNIKSKKHFAKALNKLGKEPFQPKPFFDLTNNVSEQEHYTQHALQPIVYCQSNKLSWCANNVVKYVSRENMKDGIKDLWKAMDYLKVLIIQKETGKVLTPCAIKKLKRSWR